MEYAFYIALCALLLGMLFYIVRKLIIRRRHNKVVASAVTEPSTEVADDFICIRRTDDRTTIISRGVGVTGGRS